jgi:choline-glycine betaine transporter
VPVSLFVFLENFPLAGLVSALAVLIVVIFFTTSSDSASLVIDMLCSSDVTNDPPTRQRVFWAICEGAVAGTLLAIGGLEALQDVITVLGFPFFVLGLVIIWSLLRALREETLDPTAPRRRRRGHAGPVTAAGDVVGASSDRDVSDRDAGDDDAATRADA